MSRSKKAVPANTLAATAAQANAASGGLFHLAFQNSPAMQSVVRAPDGRLVEVNDTFLRKLRFEREEVIGKTAFELNFWVDPEQLKAYRRELEAKGFVQGFEVQ